MVDMHTDRQAGKKKEIDGATQGRRVRPSCSVWLDSWIHSDQLLETPDRRTGKALHIYANLPLCLQLD